MVDALQRNLYKEDVFEKLKQLKHKIAHSLRTPLTSVKGFAEILSASTNLTSDQLESVTIILRNETRLEEVVVEIERDLINFLESFKREE
ncbi:MAG TPA: histidine kinase dimerization/phospho-acceptor domain-containing protein [Candidatus Deferrimicrobium sp.]|nr:histidine kinase dimerization/phospho-acceptor domain-containing protein [Candidatus Deferrimicrobium sp.]